MALAIAVGVIALLGALGLWLNGRYWRARWTCVSDLTPYWQDEEEISNVLVILWTGAFNTANIHYERLIDLFLQVGDVYVVNYAEKRFDAATSDDELFESVMERRPDEIVCVGASLGGEQMLRFTERVRKVRGYHPKLRHIAAGVPLGGRHLPYPRAALWLAKCLRIGPMWNLLLKWAPRAAFRPLEPDDMRGVNEEHLERHMKAMWNVKPSAMAEQVAAMVRQPPFEAITHIPTVYLHCEKEKVIKGDEALEEWKALLGEWLLEVITVPGGHVQFVERHWDWCVAFVQALKTLGYDAK